METPLRLIAVAVAALLVGCVDPRESLPDAARDGKGSGGADGGADRAMDLPKESDVADVATGPDVVQVDLGNDTAPTIDLGHDATDTPVIAPDVLPDLPLDLPPALKDNGTSCGNRVECKTGNCVEGVCCDGACANKCTSCLNTNTAKPDGQCAPVKAGAAHGSDCTASDPSTCGQNGKCDGAGACQKFPAGTTCKGESCQVGTASYSPMSTCNAQGTCTPMPRNCSNNYKCTADGARCRSNCGADTECIDAAHCDGSLCVVDVNPGAICSRSEECTSNLCSGRCCNPGEPCKCPQPNATNTAKNAGLDKTAQDWALQGAPEDGNRWDPEDADGCPFSGSVNIASDDGFPLQCVKALPSTMYNFGAWFKVASDGAVDLCQVVFYELFNCQGPYLEYFNLNVGGTKNAWISASISVRSPATAQYATLACSGGNFKMDKMFLSQAPQTF
jgi:hypothetical protein